MACLEGRIKMIMLSANHKEPSDRLGRSRKVCISFRLVPDPSTPLKIHLEPGDQSDLLLVLSTKAVCLFQDLVCWMFGTRPTQ